ncbi:hypothetical protein D3C72_1842630 [compost metagenome]
MKKLVALTLIVAFTAMNAHAGSCTAEKMDELQKTLDAAHAKSAELTKIANEIEDKMADLGNPEKMLAEEIMIDARLEALTILNDSVGVSEQLVDCITQ